MADTHLWAECETQRSIHPQSHMSIASHLPQISVFHFFKSYSFQASDNYPRHFQLLKRYHISSPLTIFPHLQVSYLSILLSALLLRILFFMIVFQGHVKVGIYQIECISNLFPAIPPVYLGN